MCGKYVKVILVLEGTTRVIENTKETRTVRNVAATIAIEKMYLSQEFVKELIKVANGEKTSEELRQEVIRKYSK